MEKCPSQNNLNNYLLFHSHCQNTTKFVLSQVTSYLDQHNHYYACQSAYRPGHSTESALQRAVNDLFLSLSKANMSILALFDFSSALHAIDHSIHVHRLHTYYRFSDTVFQWSLRHPTDKHGMPLYQTIVLLWVLWTQVFVRIQFLAICIFTCTLSFWLP